MSYLVLNHSADEEFDTLCFEFGIELDEVVRNCLHLFLYYVSLYERWQFKLCGVVWCGVVWCGVVWCGVVWCGVVGCGVVWCGVVWCGVVWCGVVWCGVVWCGVVWCGVVWCGVVWWGVVWCGGVWCPVLVDLREADGEQGARRGEG